MTGPNGYHQIAPISCLFTSAVVLLLNIWGGKSSGSSIDPAKEMQKVHQVMEIIKAMEPRCGSKCIYLPKQSDTSRNLDGMLPGVSGTLRYPAYDAIMRYVSSGIC